MPSDRGLHDQRIRFRGTKHASFQLLFGLYMRRQTVVFVGLKQIYACMFMRRGKQGYIGTIVLVLYKNYFASTATADAAPGLAAAEGAGRSYQIFFTSMSLWAGLLLCAGNLFALYYWPTEFERAIGEDSSLELEVARPIGT